MILYLSDSEARSFAQGERMLWRKIPEPPYKIIGYEYHPESIGIEYREVLPDKSLGYGVCCSYQSGSHVDLKETWGTLPRWEDIFYKADTDKHGVILIHAYCKSNHLRPHWHSPVTMPRAAVRWHMIVKSVEVEQRDEKWWWKITMEEKCTTPPNG